MDDGHFPKDILYGELTTGTRQTGRPALRFKDTCKRDMKACGLNPANLEQDMSDRTLWHSAEKASVEYAEENRERMWEEKGSRWKQQLHTVPADPTTPPEDHTCNKYYRSC